MARPPHSRQELLGCGWSLPVRLDEQGEIALVDGPDVVAQAIWSILATAPGERVGEPGFGCGIHDLVFGPSDGSTAAHVGEQVQRALEAWEPRIELLAVRVENDAAQSLMLIAVDYRLRAAPGTHNLVFPFYLEGAR